MSPIPRQIWLTSGQCWWKTRAGMQHGVLHPKTTLDTTTRLEDRCGMRNPLTDVQHARPGGSNVGPTSAEYRPPAGPPQPLILVASPRAPPGRKVLPHLGSAPPRCALRGRVVGGPRIGPSSTRTRLDMGRRSIPDRPRNRPSPTPVRPHTSTLTSNPKSARSRPTSTPNRPTIDLASAPT